MNDEQFAFYKQCDGMGDAEVRRTLAAGRWNERRSAWAKAWVAEQENSQAAQAQSTSHAIGKSAARAAWASAILAGLSLVVSIIALARTL